VPDSAITDLVASLSSAATPSTPRTGPGSARLLPSLGGSGPFAQTLRVASPASTLRAGTGTLAQALRASSPASTLRASSPRTWPGCNSARQSEKTFDIWIYFTDSEDHMRVTVPPSLRLGPPAHGSEADTDAAVGRGSVGPWRAESLKGLIEAACDIEVGRQRFFFRQTALINDGLSLKSYGIGDGDQLKLRILKHGSHSMGVKACRSERLRGDRLAGKYDGWALAKTKHIKQCRNSQGVVYMQPKWNKVPPQSEPHISLAAGCSYSSRMHGSGALAHPVYVKDRDDNQMRNLRTRLSVL